MNIKIAGKGNKLFLVCCEKSMRVKKLKISTYDKIHKISFTQKDDGIYRVACAAGKELLLSDIVDNEFENSRIVKLSDWISSTQFIQRDLAIMTAHSQIAILNKDDKIYRKIHCDETSTLYCSFIYVESSNQLLFFGGTALGELLVWTEKKTIFRQFLHNGVIFSIDYNGTNLVKQEFLVNSFLSNPY